VVAGATKAIAVPAARRALGPDARNTGFCAEQRSVRDLAIAAALATRTPDAGH